MSEKDKCPGWQGEECWYDKELKRYVVTGWDSNETCPTCKGTGEKKLDRPDKEWIKRDIEKVFAEVAGLEPKNHKNVIGDKWKFIDAIVEYIALFPDNNTSCVGLENCCDLEELKNKWTFELGEIARQATNKAVEEAEREERERILKEYTVCMATQPSNIHIILKQALEGGK